MRDKYQVTEEPCELKGSSTVLESSGSCERIADFTRSTHDAQKSLFNNLRSTCNGIDKRVIVSNQESTQNIPNKGHLKVVW